MVKQKNVQNDSPPDLGRLHAAIQQLIGNDAPRGETLKVLKEFSLLMLTEKELSRLWGIKIGTLRNWRSAGSGPPFAKLEGSVRYSLMELSAYANENTIK